MRASRLHVLAAAAIVPMAGTIFAHPALAQDTAEAQDTDTAESQDTAESTGSAAQLNEITVTAQRRTENLQEVPIAIVAVSGERIAQAGVTNLQQLNAVVPGVSFRNSNGALQPFIRGIGTTASSVENPVALYVDGAYIANQREIGVDLIDVDQVAVLKGPQGTLFGRNTTGGVVQITTKGPSDTFNALANVSFDNYQTLRAQAFVSGPLADQVGASLMASYTTQEEGWARNPVNGQELYRIDHRINLRGQLHVDFNDAIDLRLSVDHQDRDGSDGLYYRPYPGTTLFYPGYVETNDPHSHQGDSPGFMRVRSTGGSATFNVDLGFAKLVSISGARRGRVRSFFDSDSSPVLVQNIQTYESWSNQSQELQLVSPGSGKLNWVLGAYYFHQHQLLSPNEVFTFGPAAPLPTSNASSRTYGDQHTSSWAGFAQGTIELVPSTNLTVGLRYTTESRDYSGSRSNTRNNGATFAPIAPINGTATFNMWTWRLALDHRLSEDAMAYVSYNRGFKSGGFVLGNPTNPPYQPEQVDAYEVGLKAEFFDRRLRLNTGLFYYDYKNAQVTYYTTVGVVANAAAARVYGIDIDMEAQLTDHLNIIGGLSAIDAEFTDYPAAPSFINRLPTLTNLAIQIDATGNQLPFAHPLQASLGVNFDIDTSVGNILFSGTGTYNSRSYMEADNVLFQPAYTYLNASVTWTSLDERFNVKLWGTNLLDEAVQSVSSSQGLGYLAAYGNPPLLYGVSVGFRY